MDVGLLLSLVEGAFWEFKDPFPDRDPKSGHQNQPWGLLAPTVHQRNRLNFLKWLFSSGAAALGRYPLKFLHIIVIAVFFSPGDRKPGFVEREGPRFRFFVEKVGFELGPDQFQFSIRGQIFAFRSPFLGLRALFRGLFALATLVVLEGEQRGVRDLGREGLEVLSTGHE